MPVRKHPVEQPPLLPYTTEILTILYTYHEDISRDREGLVVIDKGIAALRWQRSREIIESFALTFIQVGR